MPGLGRFLMWVAFRVLTLGTTCVEVRYRDGLHITMHRLGVWGLCEHRRREGWRENDAKL